MPEFKIVSISTIVESFYNPRKQFDNARLEELADSIKNSGVLQPILLRPLPGSRVADTDSSVVYEIIAGARRFRASKIAGALTIPAVVREMSDSAAMEAAILENLQRDDLTALEEAQGYEVLMQHSGITAEQVAEKIGKSRTYVFNRLKLMDLGQDGREALRMGMLDASKALLLARIPDTALQVKALQEILRPNHPEGVMSARMAGEWIRSRYMLKLEQAPFNADDTSFIQGSCSGCLKRTGAAPDIFADVKGADVCTDPTCYEAKVQVHRTRVREALEADGHTVIDEREAKEIMPMAMSALKGYARLDAAQDNPAGNGVTLRVELASVLESGELKPTMLANPHKEGELIACVPDEEVAHWLTKAGRKKAAKAASEGVQSQHDEDAEKRGRELRNSFETEWRQRVVKFLRMEIDDKAPGDGLSQDMMHQLAHETMDSLGTDDLKDIAQMMDLGEVSPADGVKMWVDTCAQGNANWSIADALTLLLAVRDRRFFAGWKPEDQENEALLIAAKDAGIDIDAVKAQVQAEMTEREAQKAAEKQAALDAAKAPLPLAPAAQASGVRGKAKAKKGKGQKNPADAGAGLGRLSAQEAMQGIADALQGDEAPDAARRSEAISGADAPGEGVGPAARPDGAAQTVGGGAIDAAHDADPGAQASADGATPSLASQAGAVDQADGASVKEEQEVLGVGSRVRVIFDSPTFKGKVGKVSAINSKGTASIALDGFESEFTFEVGEFEWVEGGAA